MSYRSSLRSLVAGAAVLSMLAACRPSAGCLDLPKPEVPASSATYESFDELVRDADLIVLGTILDLNIEPDKFNFEFPGQDHFTAVHRAQVEAVFKGSPTFTEVDRAGETPEPQAIAVGNDRSCLERGDTYYLFLEDLISERPGGFTDDPDQPDIQGDYRELGNRARFVVDGDRVDVSEEVLPHASLGEVVSVAQFEAAIKEALGSTSENG